MHTVEFGRSFPESGGFPHFFGNGPDYVPDLDKQQIKYTNNECIKNFRDPKTPPLKFFFLYAWVFPVF